MANIPGAKVKMNDIEIAQEAALSEAVHTKIGANINALIDDTNTNAGNIATNTSNISAVSSRVTSVENKSCQVIAQSPATKNVDGATFDEEWVIFSGFTIRANPTAARKMLIQLHRVTHTVGGNTVFKAPVQVLTNPTFTGFFRWEFRVDGGGWNTFFSGNFVSQAATPLASLLNASIEIPRVIELGAFGSDQTLDLRIYGDFVGSGSTTIIRIEDYQVLITQVS